MLRVQLGHLKCSGGVQRPDTDVAHPGCLSILDKATCLACTASWPSVVDVGTGGFFDNAQCRRPKVTQFMPKSNISDELVALNLWDVCPKSIDLFGMCPLCGSSTETSTKLGLPSSARQNIHPRFYIKAARKSFQKATVQGLKPKLVFDLTPLCQGLKQQQGIDKSNSDPFIKQHEGQLQVPFLFPHLEVCLNSFWVKLQDDHFGGKVAFPGLCQVLGALDLAPEDPEIWFEAGKVRASLKGKFLISNDLNVNPLMVRTSDLCSTFLRSLCPWPPWAKAKDHGMVW